MLSFWRGNCKALDLGRLKVRWVVSSHSRENLREIFRITNLVRRCWLVKRQVGQHTAGPEGQSLTISSTQCAQDSVRIYAVEYNCFAGFLHPRTSASSGRHSRNYLGEFLVQLMESQSRKIPITAIVWILYNFYDANRSPYYVFTDSEETFHDDLDCSYARIFPLWLKISGAWARFKSNVCWTLFRVLWYAKQFRPWSIKFV